MIKRLLRFLGWLDRRPGHMWPFPFAAFEPKPSLSEIHAWHERRERGEDS